MSKMPLSYLRAFNLRMGHGVNCALAEVISFSFGREIPQLGLFWITQTLAVPRKINDWQLIDTRHSSENNLDLPLITELHCREEEADKVIDGFDVSRPRNLDTGLCVRASGKNRLGSEKKERKKFRKKSCAKNASKSNGVTCHSA